MSNAYFLGKNKKNILKCLLKILPACYAVTLLLFWPHFHVCDKSICFCDFYSLSLMVQSTLSRSVNLTTLYLGSHFCKPLTRTYALSFVRNWPPHWPALLESAKGENDRRKKVHDQSLRKNVAGPGGDRTRNLLITGRACTRLSHRGRLFLALLLGILHTFGSFQLVFTRKQLVRLLFEREQRKKNKKKEFWQLPPFMMPFHFMLSTLGPVVQSIVSLTCSLVIKMWTVIVRIISNSQVFLPLRKHAYSNILKITSPKTESFQIKNSDIFHISAQNIDCGYSLEPPRRGGSNEYPQYMFLSRNKKNNVYPCKPQFYYIKVGFIYRII